ncbi:MAG: HAD hydrolase-like protein [Methanomicrobiales archaeon]
MDFEISDEHIFTPSLAAVANVKKTGKNNCYLLITGDVDRDFEPVCARDSGAKPDFVIVGDAEETITYDNLNSAFRGLMEGAELIALEKDRYWMANDGLSLPAAPFVQTLEFASGKTAMVMGKHSASFFAMALQDIGLRTGEVLMIGDDIYTGIDGAQQAGMRTVLVSTGKFRENALKSAMIKPAWIIDFIVKLGEIL